MASSEIEHTDRSLLRAGITAVFVAVATAIAYGMTLAWDTEYDVAADGSQSGPYSGAQVAILVLLLVTVVGYAGWRENPILGSAVATLVLVTLWASSAASTDDSGLWAVGAVMLLIGSFGGLTIVGLLGATARQRRRQS